MNVSLDFIIYFYYIRFQNKRKLICHTSSFLHICHQTLTYLVLQLLFSTFIYYKSNFNYYELILIIMTNVLQKYCVILYGFLNDFFLLSLDFWLSLTYKKVNFATPLPSKSLKSPSLTMHHRTKTGQSTIRI